MGMTAMAKWVWLGTVLAAAAAVSSVAAEATNGSSSSSSGGLDMLPFPEGKSGRKTEMHGHLGLTLGLDTFLPGVVFFRL